MDLNTSGLEYLFWYIICPLVRFVLPSGKRTLTLGPEGVPLREVQIQYLQKEVSENKSVRTF